MEQQTHRIFILEAVIVARFVLFYFIIYYHPLHVLSFLQWVFSVNEQIKKLAVIISDYNDTTSFYLIWFENLQQSRRKTSRARDLVSDLQNERALQQKRRIFVSRSPSISHCNWYRLRETNVNTPERRKTRKQIESPGLLPRSERSSKELDLVPTSTRPLDHN